MTDRLLPDAKRLRCAAILNHKEIEIAIGKLLTMFTRIAALVIAIKQP